MDLSKIVSVISFVGAFLVGIAVGYIAEDRKEILAVEAPSVSPLKPVFKPVAVRAENLVGVWRGTWGYNRADCTIEIDRITGKKFFGTLRKGDAEIALVGTIDPDARTISFQETKVVSQGEYGQWSLGTNTGNFSSDGRTLTGTGSDKWGTYGWDATKD